MRRQSAALATVTGKGIRNATGPTPGKAGSPAIIRKPGDLPANGNVTGRGVPGAGNGLMALSFLPASRLRDFVVSALPPVELLVCTTCKREGVDPEAKRPGAVLHDALSAANLPENVVLKPVECLSNCSQGCSLVLRGGDARWTYVYGNLGDDAVEIVVDGATRYAATADGLVPWRERPEHFRKNCIARIPPLAPAVPKL